MANEHFCCHFLEDILGENDGGRMPYFHFNLHTITVPGHGLLSSMSGVGDAAQALAETSCGSYFELASPKGTPFETSPSLTQKLMAAGMTRFSIPDGEIPFERLSADQYKRALKSILRHPLEKAARNRLGTDRRFGRRLREHIDIASDGGDIPQVHEAIQQRRMAFLEIKGVWDLASPFLSSEELTCIFRYCRGPAAKRVLADPRFPIEGAAPMIARYVARRMRTPDFLLMRPSRVEHHIEEMADSDFHRTAPSYMRYLSLWNRRFWYYVFFAEEETPEDRFCDTIYLVLGGLLVRPEPQQEAVFAEMEKTHPQLAWLLRRIRDTDPEVRLTDLKNRANPG